MHQNSSQRRFRCPEASKLMPFFGGLCISCIALPKDRSSVAFISQLNQFCLFRLHRGIEALSGSCRGCGVACIITPAVYNFSATAMGLSCLKINLNSRLFGIMSCHSFQKKHTRHHLKDLQNDLSHTIFESHGVEHLQQ